MTFLITGANKGIGLELTRLALESGNKVLAGVRSLSRAQDLKSLESTGRLTIIELDASSDQSVQSAAQKIDEPIDVLINNAGVFLDPKASTLKDLSIDILEKTFQTNTLGPVRVTKAFSKNIKNSKAPTVTNITSMMASMTDNHSGTAYAYRMSKIALNMFSKNLSIENPNWTVLSVHPGWVQTDMGGQGATVKPVESAKGILNLTLNSKTNQSGKFFDYQGKELPW